MAFVIRLKERQRFFGWAFLVNKGIKRDMWKWTAAKEDATQLAQLDEIPKKFRQANGRLKRKYTLVLLNQRQED